MKNKLASIAFFLLLTIPVSVSAQKSLSEGKIVFDISLAEGDMDPQMKAMMPSESTVFIKNGKSRTEISMAMGMSSASIFDAKTGQITALTDFMGNKTYMTMDAQKDGAKDSKPTVEQTAETKTIAGYVCKKAVIKMKDGSSVNVYHTDKINARMAEMVGAKDLGGYPLEYTVDQMGFKMTFTARSVAAEKVSDDQFKVPAGYKFVTQEELQKMYGGGN
ncbi:MAG: DUF4412 domain-containing protein [Bacteroidota bacterium]|jgi:GLPGLI family protein